MTISILSATTTNKPGYIGPIDGSSLPPYDRAFQPKRVEDKEDTSEHRTLEAAASDWHGSIIEDTDEC
jgi:hypothetical protein